MDWNKKNWDQRTTEQQADDSENDSELNPPSNNDQHTFATKILEPFTLMKECFLHLSDGSGLLLPPWKENLYENHEDYPAYSEYKDRLNSYVTTKLKEKEDTTRNNYITVIRNGVINLCILTVGVSIGFVFCKFRQSTHLCLIRDR